MKLFKVYLSVVLASLCLVISSMPKVEADTGDVLKSVGRGVLTTGAAAGGVVAGAVAGTSLLYFGVTGFYELGCKLGLFRSGSRSEKFLNYILDILLWGRTGTFDALSPIFTYGAISAITGASIGGTAAGKAVYKMLS